MIMIHEGNLDLIVLTIHCWRRNISASLIHVRIRFKPQEEKQEKKVISRP